MKAIIALKAVTLFLGFSLIASVSYSQEVEQGAFYVDINSGSDSNDGRAVREGGSGPWRTVQHAAQTLEAGQTVYIREGVYTEPDPIEGSTKAWGIRPANDGADGNLIRFLGYPGEKVVIDMKFQAPCIVLYGRKYVEISGLELTNCWQSGVWVMSGSGRENSDILISNNIIHGIDAGSGTNVAAVRMDHVGNSRIQDNVMYNIRVAGVDNANAAGVLSYRMHDVIINNNEIYDVYSGIFHKIPDYEGRKGGIFEKNLIHDVKLAFYFNTNEGVPEQGIHYNTEIRHNVVYSTTAFIYETTDQSLGQNRGLKVYNNTVDGGDISLRGFADVEIFNNVFFRSGGISTIYQSDALSRSDRKTPSISYSDYNLFYPSFQGVIGLYSGSEVKAASLSEWQRIGYGGDPFTLNVSAPGPDQNSIEKDPLFVGLNARDYRLTALSPAKTSGRNGDNIGAYTSNVTEVGPRGTKYPEGTRVAPPQAPELNVQ
jgi:hypothetical protein